MGRTLSCSVVVILALTACGPSLEGESNDELGASSGEQASTATPADPTASTPEASSGDAAETTEDGGDWGTSGGFDDDNDDDDDDDDDEGEDDGYVCGCEDTVPVGFEDVVDGEFSAATVVASVENTEIPWNWTAFVDAPPQTVLTVALSYEGGQVLHGPEGEDGCSFLSSPCANALLIPVVATLTTADGVLVASLPGTLDVDLDRWSREIVFQEELGAEALGGTLMAQPLAESASALTSISVYLGWEIGGTSPGLYLGGMTADGDVVLGEELG